MWLLLGPLIPGPLGVGAAHTCVVEHGESSVHVEGFEMTVRLVRLVIIIISTMPRIHGTQLSKSFRSTV